MIIRELWLQKSSSVASPPILVLSYKNMAIDHFLVDLVKSSPGLSASGKLLRIGGHSSDARLARFSERAAFHSDAEVNAARSCVDKLDTIRDSIKSLLSGNVASFLSNRILVFEDGDDDSRRKAANKATDALMECIVMRHLILVVNQDEVTKAAPASVANLLRFLEKDGKGQSDKRIARLTLGENGMDFIAKLEESVAQSEKMHWGDLVLKWLCGKRPLPRCQFVDKTGNPCDSVAISHDAQLCDKHRCYFIDDGRCETLVRHGELYCETHGCKVSRCKFPILAANQSFCLSHACKRCVELAKVAHVSIARPPRNVCSQHPICTFPSCLDYCSSDGIYCQKHNVVSCMATTKRSHPCKGQPISRYKPFCRDHLHLAGTLAFETDSFDSDNSSVSDAAEVQATSPEPLREACIAKTKKGLQCRGTALPGTKYCYDHEPPMEAKSMFLYEAHQSSRVLCSEELAQTIAAENKGQIEANAIQNTIDNDLDKNGADCDGRHGVTATSGTTSDGCQGLTGATVDALSEKKSPADQDEIEYEDDEGENLKHLLDVFDLNAGIESDGESISSAVESDFDDFQDAECDSSSLDSSALINSDPNEWTWEMSIEDRWLACHQLMEELRGLLTQNGRCVGQAISVARKDLRQAKIRAKSRLYENKAIIGGTMVGCISRLDSIQATRPFAVICEEASEVLEPLLFSCLSECTLKLEMVGDHRQLQPSVMSRFDFEMLNKVNFSMFQRLIEAPSGHEIPNCVLSVQRRMRKNICDLTRGYYTDVVEIKDHETCFLQVIGQRSTISSSTVRSSLSGGREVPGVLPHLFMWTHKGEQKKAHVGISRINQEEAEMACSLAAYLVECGVPRPSICILTPYKGQLVLIRNLLLKESKFRPSQLISRNPEDTDVCRVSTVDRFQGDEEDIIIASLVVDANSRTGFVKLINRMIVLLSRARLGFYLLANAGFLENSTIPDHWRKTLKILESPGETDSPVCVDGAPSLPRCGSKIPLCCPVHRQITMLVDSAAKVRTGFCTELCNQVLACGHECALQCHWPQSIHNNRCSQRLESPCTRHSHNLECWMAFENAKSAPFGTQHHKIMQYFKCPVEVELLLPCDHKINLPCWKEKEIVNGQVSWPVCNLLSSKPFIFSRCGHSRDVTCAELANYTAAPDSICCTAPGTYQSTCGHEHAMRCWEIELYANGSKVFDCRKSLEETLPRCGHRQRLLCAIASKLAGWSGQSCVEVGIVNEGTDYGPLDHHCKEKSTLVRKCGHNLNLSCPEAFSRVNSLQPCRTPLRALHPYCGHNCRIPCCDFGKIRETGAPAPMDEYVEGNIPAKPVLDIAVPRCSKRVRIVRACGHAVEVACSDVGKPLTGCKELVRKTSPLCGHETELPCHAVPEFQKDVWTSEAFSTLCTSGKVGRDAQLQRDLDCIDPGILNALVNCDGSRLVDLSCGHDTLIKCSDLLKWATDGGKFSLNCSASVSVKLGCGHQAEAICGQATQGKTGLNTSIVCSAMKRQACWNHAVCGRKHSVQCGFLGTVACKDYSLRWTCRHGVHTYDVNLCSSGTPKSCPGCSMEELDKAISYPLSIRSPDISLLLKGLPQECVTHLGQSEEAISAREKELFRRYKSHLVTLPEWERPLFVCKRVPCYRVLKDNNLLMDRFDPSVFVRPASMHGIISKTLTNPNLLQLASTTADDKQLTVLVGYATVARTYLRNSISLPKNRKAKASMLQTLFQDEFDSMLYHEKGFEALIVWDPFPMVATHRLLLGKENILHIANSLLGPQKIAYAPQLPKFESPPTGYVEIEVASNCVDEDQADSGTADDSEEETTDDFSSDIANCFRGTILQGYGVDCYWRGGIESRGLLSPNEENELKGKMQFVDRSALPFAALQRIKKLITSKKDVLILRLLLAAELCIHDPKRAKEEMQSYTDGLKTQGGNKVHPWSILVAARSDPVRCKRLLCLFLQLFPHQNKLLSSEEREMVQCVGDAEKSTDWSILLKDEWRDLQSQYPSETQSKDMDSLLGLVGLRKVKVEALNLWKSALQLRKLSRERRRENFITSNYVFLGNPGSGKTTGKFSVLVMEVSCGALDH
jgi:AAA domain